MVGCYSADDRLMAMWKANGFDHCVIGTVIVPGEPEERIVYDALKCILTIQLNSGGEEECSFEDAEEYFIFNVVGAVIESGPAYVYLKTLEEIEEIQELRAEWELDTEGEIRDHPPLAGNEGGTMH